eukprot:TRINITY_DN18699_c0_g2_i2.p1 TRINITY_DN18699_c0_g2~~TRINITY_DN18699_c0_g2_i2.p1  ORF type:complete len:358 (+),score=38.51 TRINITY_DN18699_c0_g2_i2:161-1234(+)
MWCCCLSDKDQDKERNHGEHAEDNTPELSDIHMEIIDEDGDKTDSPPAGRGGRGRSRGGGNRGRGGRGRGAASPIVSSSIQWVPDQVIGRGAFGVVYSGHDARTGTRMALKRVKIPMNDYSDIDTTLTKMRREITLLSRLEHENVVGYIGCERDIENSDLCIYMELIQGGSVSELIATGGLPEVQVHGLIRQLVAGLVYLHAQGVMHRDIKSMNLLLDSDTGLLKVCDFGAAKEVSQMFSSKTSLGSESTGIAGTPNWMAPEVIKTGKHTPASDVWSVGCVMIELSTGKPPYHDCQGVWQVMYQISEGHMPAMPVNINHEGHQFLECCMQQEPSQRPTSQQLSEHVYLRTVPGPTTR